MTLLYFGVGAVILWMLVRLGRQTERAGRGHWRIASTMMAAALFVGAVIAAARGVWIGAGAMAAAGLWLTVASRVRSTRSRPIDPSRMTDAEARRLLGVSAAANRGEIQAAWRRLMARAHPDQGGTQGLAEQLNQARDRLLKG
ncbi:molecular chaperone DnaJ [Brevundimonas lutea]|uniref:molecular chaperone DnaJ n=1 Tax=Brevundimonas lutea TaxID=2293980 RepID=UPI000F03A27D|nr:molecular chaperone DnaJ [Brevundimonas lutea]